MSTTPTLFPGGAVVALTTTETTIDMSNLRGLEISLCCDLQDFWFCASDRATGNTLVTTAPTAASSTALIADRGLAGTKIHRIVGSARYLVVKTNSLTDTLRIKVVGSGILAGEVGKLPYHLLPTS